MVMNTEKLLLIGYGNPGRLDDGLGPAFAEAISQESFSNLTVDSNYMLTVEDAHAIAQHDKVIFVDASVDGAEPFFFKRISPKPSLSFTSHHIDPEAVLALGQDLFDAKTQGYVLGIRGYEFDEFGQRLSDQAQNNLMDALDFFKRLMGEQNFENATSSMGIIQ